MFLGIPEVRYYLTGAHNPIPIPLASMAANRMSAAVYFLVILIRGVGFSYSGLFLELTMGIMIPKSIAKRNDVSQSTLAAP
jgi:hypothetical protein